MKDVGRNDPCPCGSGAKYKYCCMNEDTGDDVSAFDTSFLDADASDADASPLEEVYERFNRADYDGKKALVEEIIGDPERMDEENAFHTFNELYPIAIERGEAEWLRRQLTRLEREQPEVYAAEQPYLLFYLLGAAVATGDLASVVRDRVDDLVTMADRDIDQFHPCLELLAYHGLLAPIARIMTEAWPDVRENPDIMPHGKNNFANQGLQYALLAYYEQNGTVDLQDPDLRDQIEVYDETEEGEVDFDYLERFAERVSGPSDQPWQIEDDPKENIYWLVVDFMCAVHEDDVPLSRAHIAREHILECYTSQSEKGTVVTLEPNRTDLGLSRSEIEQKLESIGSFVSTRPHRKGAFFTLLPAWVGFLEERALLSSKDRASMMRALHGLKSSVLRAIQNVSSDPILAADVKGALD